MLEGNKVDDELIIRQIHVGDRYWACDVNGENWQIVQISHEQDGQYLVVWSLLDQIAGAMNLLFGGGIKWKT